MRYAGVSACHVDAADEVKAYCDIVLVPKGGEGAVWAFIELFLKKKNLWEKAIVDVFTNADQDMQV